MPRSSTSPRAPSTGRRRAGGPPRAAGRPTASPARRPAPPAPVRRSPGSDLEQRFAASTAAAAAGSTEGRSFAQLGLPDSLVSILARRGIATPTPIQARTLPDALAGRNLLGRAQTGSGKTLAFGLPMLTRLDGGTRHPNAPRGLVLVPTRELAQQVHDALAPLGHALGVRLTTVYGGASMGRQIEALRRGVDIVVATPGRLLDLIGQGHCSLASVSITVLDEADYMADLGFLPAVTSLLDATPAGGQRLLFSATLDRGVDTLVRRYLPDPAAHAVAPAAAPVETMDHRAFTVAAEDKLAVAAEIAGRPGRTLMFVRTKHGADRLAKQLGRSGVDAGAIHGDLNQNARRRALDAFASGHARVLVATDVAARGIHVDDVDLVVHFDPPADAKDYLHRAGRTARAGATGVVLSLLLREQVRPAARLFDAAGVRADSLRAEPGSPAVREVATSGTPVVPAPLPERSPGSGQHRAARPGAAARRTGARRGRSRPGSSGRGREAARSAA